MTFPDIRDTVIKLISATRLNTQEKGLSRMRQFVDMLNAAKISFVWDCYSDSDPEIKGITHHPMQTNIRQQIRDADYLVQLSDEEGFCYSIVEALEEGTAVITTPIEVLDELGFVDGKHGYIFGFDMSARGDIQRLLQVPSFAYIYNNEPIKKQWYSILGKGKNMDSVRIRCVKRFRDMTLDKYMEVDEECVINARRAEEIISSGYAVRCI
jgi:glycosyltransferase involved in cell wall biosynthesis